MEENPWRSVDRGGQCLVAVGAEAQREGDALPGEPMDRELAGLYDVAGPGLAVASVERAVRSEVGPAVAGAEVAVGSRGEAGFGDERAGGRLIGGDEDVADWRSGVVLAFLGQRRVVVGEGLQRPAGQGAECHVGDDRGALRVNNVGERGGPTPARGGLAQREAALVVLLGADVDVLEALWRTGSLGDDQLQLADRGGAEVWVENLCHAGAAERESHRAAIGPRGAEALFVGGVNTATGGCGECRAETDG